MKSLIKTRLFSRLLTRILVIAILVIGLSGCDISGVSNFEESSSAAKNGLVPNQSPYDPDDDASWYKGNLHAHSYWGDGNDYPEMILNWYKGQGYNFGILAGHNTIQQGDKTIEFDKGTQDEAIFKEYRNEFGESWVEYEDLGSRIRVHLKSFDEYSQKVKVPGSFLPINSEEIDYRDNSRLLHVNATNVQEVIQPEEGGSTVDILQRTIDKVNQQANRLSVPMMAQINHPNINYSVSADDMKQLEDARFFEVYNGHPNSNNSGSASKMSTEEIWDEVNTEYILDDKKLLYGLATDDSHRYDISYNGPGKGWVQVRSNELSRNALITAMKRGDFYASTGVRLSDIQFNGKTLSVVIDAEAGINYTIQFIGTKEDQTDKPGVVFAEEQGPEASYTFQDRDMYVRAKIVSDKMKENSSEDGEVEVAWTQPVKNEQPPSVTNEIVYKEELSSPWINASWSSSVDFNSSEKAYTGSQSIKVQQKKWGGLSMHSGNWGAPKDVDPTEYESVKFAVYAGDVSSSISVNFENDNDDPFPQVEYGSVAADQWTEVVVPMSELNPEGHVIHRVTVSETSGSAKTYFVDDLRLSVSSSSSPQPLPEPTLVSPNEGAKDLSTSPTLAWDGNTAEYHLRVAEDSSYQAIVRDKPGLSSTSLQLSDLSPGTTYYWKVKGTDADGNTSKWSASRSFTTKEQGTGSESVMNVYKDNLESPWIDASWSSTVGYNNTEQAFSGSNAIKVMQDRWGALSMRSGSWGAPEPIDPDNYKAVAFAIYATNPSSSINVLLENDNGDFFPQVTYGSIAAGQWNEVSIPMSELNPNNFVIHRLDVLETSGESRTYYVDNVRFIEK